MRFPKSLIALTVPLLATGCGGAPSLVAFGAYFPSWLLCLVFGVAVAVATHVVLIRTDLAPLVPLQLLFCLSVGLIAAVLLSLLWLGS